MPYHTYALGQWQKLRFCWLPYKLTVILLYLLGQWLTVITTLPIIIWL